MTAQQGINECGMWNAECGMESAFRILHSSLCESGGNVAARNRASTKSVEPRKREKRESRERETVGGWSFHFAGFALFAFSRFNLARFNRLARLRRPHPLRR